MTNKNCDGLLKLPGRLANVAVAFDHNGALVKEITPSTCRDLPISLEKLGEIYLGSDCQPISKYLISPEMEIERIFNCLRFKYLQAVRMTNVANPETYLHSLFNKAFQSLAGLKVYQGNPTIRKANDAFWQEAGFAVEAKELDWQKERGELKAILRLLKVITPRPVTRAYAELIAIKPGFHELYLHDDYFNANTIPSGASPRDQVFRMLRRKEEVSALTLEAFPKEMNKRDYFGYAPCNVTEGPFVFRKSLSVSYFDEIRRIRTSSEIPELEDKFHILDYRSHDLSTQEKLEKFLELAEPFCRFPALTI